MIAALLLAQALQAEPLDVISIGGAKHVLGVPTYVTDGAGQAQWSPDGTQLFALTVPRVSPFGPPPKTPLKPKIVFWSNRQKRVIGTLEFPEFVMRPEIAWEGPSGSVILSGEFSVDGVPHTRILRAKPGGKWEPLWSPPGAGYCAAMTSERMGGVLIFFQPMPTSETKGPERIFYWLAPGASEGVPVPLPDSKLAVGIGENWVLPIYQQASRGVRYAVFHPSSGFRTVDKVDSPAPPCWVGSGQAAAKYDKKIVNFDSLWLLDSVAHSDSIGRSKSPPPFSSAMIAPKASQGDLTTAGSAVCYIDEGNLFVRSLTKLSDAEFDLILEQEEKELLTMECRQIVAALQLYLAKNDGQMPTSANLREALTPSLRGAIGFLDGFVLSYRGPENAFEVKDNGKEIIGYKEGRFGRVTVYADTHTKWERIRK